METFFSIDEEISSSQPRPQGPPREKLPTNQLRGCHLLVFVGTGTMAVNCFDTLISLHAWSHSGDDLTWKLRK